MTWRATGPTVQVAPTARTESPETALEWARQRARFYGRALLWIEAADGVSVCVAEVRPDLERVPSARLA